jgi:hypothetical protein
MFFCLALIENKTKGEKKIIAYKKSFMTSFMKWHAEYVHVKLLATYVVEVSAIKGIGGSQSINDEGSKSCM